jgi:hypothetical protein
MQLNRSSFRFLLAVLFFIATDFLSSCKEDNHESVSICLSQFRNEVDIHVNYSANSLHERSNVYRSADNVTFTYIGTVNLSQTANTGFLFRDTSLNSASTYYYKVSYGTILSEVQRIDFSPNHQLFKIYPNPVTDTLTVFSDYACGAYNLSIFNIWGELKYTEENITGLQHKIHVGNFMPFIYIVRFDFDNRSVAFRLVKQ